MLESSGFTFPLLIGLRLPVLIALVVKGDCSSQLASASLSQVRGETPRSHLSG